MTIWTDGSTHPVNPGNGGWGVVLEYQHEDNTKTVLKKNGRMEDSTTNNQAETQAVIEGIKALNRPASVTVITDSRYVEICYHKTMGGNLPNKNKKFWIELRNLVKRNKHRVNIVRVKGHSDNENNNVADKLAYDAAAKDRIIVRRERLNGKEQAS